MAFVPAVKNTQQLFSLEGILILRLYSPVLHTDYPYILIKWIPYFSKE